MEKHRNKLVGTADCDRRAPLQLPTTGFKSNGATIWEGFGHYFFMNSCYPFSSSLFLGLPLSCSEQIFLIDPYLSSLRLLSAKFCCWKLSSKKFISIILLADFKFLFGPLLYNFYHFIDILCLLRHFCPHFFCFFSHGFLCLFKYHKIIGSMSV